VTRQERAICWLMTTLCPQVEKLQRIAKDEDLAEILTDKAFRWVRSEKCPPKHKAEFFKVAGYVLGAAQALDVCVVEFVSQLLDEDENEDAEIIGAVAKYAKKWRRSEE
jgi:hypothetical protein